jgi:hypothetical protein
VLEPTGSARLGPGTTFRRSGRVPLSNLQIIRGGWEAFLKGDLEAAFSVFAPDIEALDDPQMVDDPVSRDPRDLPECSR